MAIILLNLALGMCFVAWDYVNDREDFEEAVEIFWNKNYYTRMMSRDTIVVYVIFFGAFFWTVLISYSLYTKLKIKLNELMTRRDQ